MVGHSVTVIVAVKDRRERMLRCLDALLVQDHPSFEVLVLDNDSSDGTAEAVRERARGATVPVRVEAMAGTLGQIRNRAAREFSLGELVAFTDSDCIPAPGWLRAAADKLEANPRLGVVQGRTIPQDPVVEGWPATIRVEHFSGRFEGCNVVYRRRALVESAGFAEDVGAFWDDTPAGYAVRRAGWETGFAPEAVVYHDVTYPGFWWHVARQQQHRNLALILGRYPEMRRELLLGRIFLDRRSAKFAAFLVGVSLTPVVPAAVLLSAPYLYLLITGGQRAPRLKDLVSPKRLMHALIYDTARLLGLLRGTLRTGHVVL